MDSPSVPSMTAFSLPTARWGAGWYYHHFSEDPSPWATTRPLRSRTKWNNHADLQAWAGRPGAPSRVTSPGHIDSPFFAQGAQVRLPRTCLGFWVESPTMWTTSEHVSVCSPGLRKPSLVARPHVLFSEGHPSWCDEWLIPSKNSQQQPWLKVWRATPICQGDSCCLPATGQAPAPLLACPLLPAPQTASLAVRLGCTGERAGPVSSAPSLKLLDPPYRLQWKVASPSLQSLYFQPLPLGRECRQQRWKEAGETWMGAPKERTGNSRWGW